MYNYKVDEIIDAYKKLKSYIFYSTNSIKYKILISDFEWGNLEEKFINITNSLNGNNDYLDKKIEEIKYYTLPKSFEDKEDFTSFLFISNKNLSTEYKVTKTTNFIDCPTELLIISMLWVLKIGVILESEVSEFCYANRLVMNEDSTINNWQFITFEKYFIAYSNWRDLAIKKARALHEDNQNALIINLDIKDYFNQIDIDIEGLMNIPKDHIILNRYLVRIHRKYKDIRKSKKNILPIGLPSSNILSNIYLNELDETISSISPSYYGRYVDDMLIVLPKK